jgi:phosphate transport system permease protein
MSMSEPRATSNAPPAGNSRLAPNRETPRRRLFADRAARWLVSAGGLAIIFSILGILIFILIEVWPLTAKPRVTPERQVALPGSRVGALLADEHRTHAVTLSADGQARVVRLRDGEVLDTVDVLAPAGEPAAGDPLVAMEVPAGSSLLAGASRDGRVVLVPVTFEVSFEGQDRTVTPAVRSPVAVQADPAGQPVEVFTGEVDADGKATVAAKLANGMLAVVRRTVEENLMTGETAESTERFEAPAEAKLTALVMDAEQRNLYGGTASGQLIHWTLSEGAPAEVSRVPAGSPITALTLLIGGRSLVVGQESGALSTWMPVRSGGEEGTAAGVAEETVLTRVRDFPAHSGPVRRIAPSQRDKGFLAASGGRLGLYFSTSHRVLWEGRPPLEDATALLYAPKGDAAYLASGNRLAEMAVFSPHPEATWKTLFGKTWFEGYGKPEYVWQSTGGTDDFEPKLSLTPLLVGTLKGTFYSLLLAIPLGVFGAMYTSQFMHPVYKRYLKPLIEIMASLPSVVLGFLAGLWLAPRIEQAMPGLILMLAVLPLLVLLSGYLWSLLPRSFRNRFPVGTEALLFVGVLALGIWLCFELSRPFELAAFGGSFQGWLKEVTGLGYDQRNAVVVGLAMGFAVIPIIFAIAEDAFSNVPPNLVAGSLALGADRWQTVTRVVLPTASPGIFSAVMIGFGRAVGETMIVLMATGNTPIMDWNPFNGFRTLSANIAVEIPEAPHGGTLYRALFLAALLLFIMTFVVNTVAELVRQRLRERFSQL